MSKSKKWIIKTGGKRPIRAIAKELANAGFKGGQVLKELGNITGSAEEKVVKKLRKVRGVVDISPDDISPDVGPPGSPETW